MSSTDTLTKSFSSTDTGRDIATATTTATRVSSGATPSTVARNVEREQQMTASPSPSTIRLYTSNPTSILRLDGASHTKYTLQSSRTAYLSCGYTDIHSLARKHVGTGAYPPNNKYDGTEAESTVKTCDDEQEQNQSWRYNTLMREVNEAWLEGMRSSRAPGEDHSQSLTMNEGIIGSGPDWHQSLESDASTLKSNRSRADSGHDGEVLMIGRTRTRNRNGRRS